jgi:hypothetical protein
MSTDRRAILEMLATGKITADEAERLLAALEPQPSESKPKAKYLRVVVDGDGRRDEPSRVNIRVPMQLLRAGVRLASLVPPQAQERVNRALHVHGVGIDLSQIRSENVEEIIDQLGDVSVDVEEGSRRAKVRVFCE